MRCKTLTFTFLTLFLASAFINQAYATVTVPATAYFGYGTGTYTNFQSQQTFNTVYRESDMWYFNDYGLNVENANLTVTKYFDNEELDFTVDAGAGQTSTSKIYCANLGEPYKLEGVRDWEYDGSARLVTVHVDHESSEDVKVYWGATAGGGGGGLDVDTDDEPVVLKPSFWSTQLTTIAFLVVILVVAYIFFGRGH